MYKGKTVTLIVPTWNEERNLPYLLERIPRNIVDELLIVDRPSTDKSMKIVKKYFPKASIYVQQGKGKGKALELGFNKAKGHYIAMIDADGSMDPGELKLYLESLHNGNDVVKGSRFMAGGGSEDFSLIREFGDWFFTKMVNILYNAKYTDLCYGYMAFKKSALKNMRFHSKGFVIETELDIRLLKRGLKVDEVPSFERKRLFGDSHLVTFRDGFGILVEIISEKFRKEK